MEILKTKILIGLFLLTLAPVQAEWKAPRPRGATPGGGGGGNSGGSNSGGGISSGGGSGGGRIHRSPSSSGGVGSSTPRNSRTTIIRRDPVPSQIRSRERTEIRPGQYYWHRREGRRYGHYYNRGVHWYGFYDGPSFYWSRYHGHYWWRYDNHFDRWVYWHGGYWWWAAPAGGTYIYVDNSYYPYESAADLPPTERVVSMPSLSEGATYNSPNKKIMVQVAGSNGDAFLYDNADSSPRFVKVLAAGVSKVRFSDAKADRPVQILVEFKKGGFALYGTDGSPVGVEGGVDAPSLEGTPPADLPPGGDVLDD